MTFEEWYAAVDKNVFRSGEEHMKVAFAAGAEQMREKSALEMVKEGEHEYADMIRNLPVGESSRAPEGSTKS